MATRLYAVADPARAPELNDHIQRLMPLQAQCLYQGKLDPEVARHCPHLVELSPGDPLVRLWSQAGWGQAWGMWLESSAGFRSVWRRLRHFTQAILPDGSGPVLFRFWDPRVLRVYMPLVEADQLPEWFKDIDAYMVETEDGKGALRWSLAGGALKTAAGPPPAQWGSLRVLARADQA